MTEKKKGEMTVREAGRLGGHKGGEVVSHKVPEIREENKERGAYPLGREKIGKKSGTARKEEAREGKETPESWEERARETLEKAGHRGGEAVAKKVPRIREENKERGARPYKGK